MKIQDQIFEKKKCHDFVTDHRFQNKCYYQKLNFCTPVILMGGIVWHTIVHQTIPLVFLWSVYFCLFLPGTFDFGHFLSETNVRRYIMCIMLHGIIAILLLRSCLR